MHRVTLRVPWDLLAERMIVKNLSCPIGPRLFVSTPVISGPVDSFRSKSSQSNPNCREGCHEIYF